MTSLFKKYNIKLVNTACCLGGIISLYVIFLDLPLIDQNLTDHYLFGRAMTAVMCFYILFEVNILKRQHEAQVPLLYASLVAYALHGQYFMPCYYLGFMQVVAGFAFFFPLEKKVFYPLSIVSTTLMVFIIQISPATYSQIVEIDQKFRFDASLGVIIMSIISLVGYRYITFERLRKDLLYRKFVDVGRNSATIIHDLKGIIFSPLLYVNLIDKRVKENNFKDLHLLVDELKSEIEYVNDYVKNVNHLSDQQDSGTAEINCEAIINSICKVLFKNKLKNKEVSIQVDGKIFGDNSSFKSTIINLMTNSLENFESKRVVDPKIYIEITNQKLIFKDNGGGFSEKALHSIQDELPFSEKDNGTGIGLFVIRDFMTDQGGKVNFYNEKAHAVVELNFNKKFRT